MCADPRVCVYFGGDDQRAEQTLRDTPRRLTLDTRLNLLCAVQVQGGTRRSSPGYTENIGFTVLTFEEARRG